MIGRSWIRSGCPLPFGLTVPQLYRWAKTLVQWTTTFSDSTWAIAASTPILTSVNEFWANLSTTDSVGANAIFNVTVTHYNKSTPVGRVFWFKNWYASAPGGTPHSAIGTYAFSAGGSAWQSSAPIQKYVLTDASGHCTFQHTLAPTVSAYWHMDVDGLVFVHPTKIIWS